jgi:hypothetical protein
MSKEIYRYSFLPSLPFDQVEASLTLAILATQSLHGPAQTQLDAAHFLDPAKRACAIDAETTVGRDLNRLFVGFLQREFGEDSFQVERIASNPVAA